MSDVSIIKKLSSQKLSEKYFELIGCMNNISITPSEAELLGYIVINGFPRTREEKNKYFKECKRSEPTLNNLVGPLKKKGFLTGGKRKTILNPIFVLNPAESLTINITINITIENEQ